MKRLLLGAGVLILTLSYCKVSASANAGFTQYLEDIECPPIECTEYQVPEYSGFKSFMTYRKFGRKTTQYELQSFAVTDENGFRKVDDYYMVAIGSYFNAAVGQRVDLILENGEVIQCVVGDHKAKQDTDTAHIFSKNSCMSEFIVDIKVLDKTVKTRGDVSMFPDEQWNSPVVEVVVYEEFVEGIK